MSKQSKPRRKPHPAPSSVKTKGDLIAKDLRDIRSSWPLMLPVLRVDASRVRSVPQALPPAPLTVISLRHKVSRHMADLARSVIRDRDLQSRPPSSDTPDVCGFLLPHADWLGEQRTGEKVVKELGDLATACVNVAAELRPKAVSLPYRCPVEVLEPEGPRTCKAMLTSMSYDAQDRNADHSLLPDEIRCAATEPHRWAPGEYRTLGRLVGSPNAVLDGFPDDL